MADVTGDLLAEVAAYYSAKLAAHGAIARGVDWNGEESQRVRFAQLAKLITPSHDFSINDLGCGYGALFDYLDQSCRDFQYCGIDVSADMINAARTCIGIRDNVRLEVAAAPPIPADYAIASGIFNVRSHRSDTEWRAYLEATLCVLDRSGRRGFAFNCLTSYSDVDMMRLDLYYADPCGMFELCKRRFSPNIALLHDYGLYEFTILVRKTA